MKDTRQINESTTERHAQMLGMEYLDGTKLETIQLYPQVLSLKQMVDNHVVVVAMDGNNIKFGVTFQAPQPLFSTLKRKYSGQSVSFAMISDDTFKDFITRYDPPKKVEYADIDIAADSDSGVFDEVNNTLNSVASDAIFNYLARQAHRLKASDIHLESQYDGVRVRFRVDGVMHLIARISKEKYRQLSGSIAVIANISSASPVPQTGHARYDIQNDSGSTVASVNMRFETILTLYGQDVVIRLFQMEEGLLKLDKLGLSKPHAQAIESIIRRPSGMVLSVGPTGSGKTTTLYSLLNRLNDDGRKIVTLEDPIEYNLDGLVQIPVNTQQHIGFAENLSSVLRMDPDIIMLGEIRDMDSARTALQAALSGHLVLSTFHASDTAATLSRFSQLIGDNPLLGSAIRLVIAQRLLRKLDPNSKIEIELDSSTRAWFQDQIDSLPESIPRPDLNNTQFYSAGLNESSPFGYSGQLAIIEMLELDSDLHELLQNTPKVDSSVIHQHLRSKGLTTLAQEGVLKAVAGETSASEVLRVVG